MVGTHDDDARGAAPGACDCTAADGVCARTGGASTPARSHRPTSADVRRQHRADRSGRFPTSAGFGATQGRRRDRTDDRGAPERARPAAPARAAQPRARRCSGRAGRQPASPPGAPWSRSAPRSSADQHDGRTRRPPHAALLAARAARARGSHPGGDTTGLTKRWTAHPAPGRRGAVRAGGGRFRRD